MLKCFKMQETALLHYLIIILQLHLNLNIYQFIEEDTK